MLNPFFNLKETFEIEGEYIELSIRKKDNLPSYGFENMLDESIVDDTVQAEPLTKRPALQ
mgnify:CR=1 FL=1